MISRTWHGMVPLEKKIDFEAYLHKTGIEESTSLDGNLGAYVKIIEQDHYAHFFLCTVWSSWEAIHLFAGSEPTIAVTYPEDAKYGLISDPIVIHQEVITSDNPF
ncbi:hypothetical protein FJQ98_08760 [Lysinibacillus agricola]|uniref:Antibiotic biosynthesis monooxygenase n=1 Tax=Lysinibacillus agricola TaxID=2590012 RepID=A0ABX7AX66_9BACI|nr:MULTISPECIES: hypothetical protein [Lysinibacillus]KOS63582.1 hypothetical protein AN161_06330 [Lysinibacillus sp. FJAT-14222]QQP14092.1 hypothetical protein FJQ98_08760 [Lysinibacillus agricola]